jgi:NAD-dependent dihydropyrimidine dehydrogenase PreA subunit
MAYLISETCTGNETACMDTCPVGCIYPKEAAPANGKRRLYVDAEQCTECGACALACPEGAILSVCGAPRYQPLSPKPVRTSSALVGSIGGWDGTEEHIVGNEEIEIPGDKLIPNGRVESWSDQMSAMAD